MVPWNPGWDATPHSITGSIPATASIVSLTSSTSSLTSAAPGSTLTSSSPISTIPSSAPTSPTAFPTPLDTNTPTPASTSTARTVLGPLTSIFTPPNACTRCFHNIQYDDFWYYSGCHVYAGDCNGLRPCLPSATYSTGKGESSGFYSPGLYCPLGWTTALHMDTSVYGTAFNTLLPGEEAAYCCPSGMDFMDWDTDSLNHLNRPFDSPALCGHSFDSGLYPTAVSACGQQTETGIPQTWNMTFSMTTGTYWSIAPAIQINWRAVDQSLTLTSSITPSLNQGNSTTPPSPATATTTPVTPGQRGFSGPQVVGVAVGAVLGTLSLSLLAWFLIRHLQRRKRTIHELGSGDGAEEDKRDVAQEADTGEVVAQDIDAVHEVHEKPGDDLPPPIYELPSPSSPAELDSAILPEMQGMLSEASRRSSGVDEETVLGGWF